MKHNIKILLLFFMLLATSTKTVANDAQQLMLRIADDKIFAAHHVAWNKVMHEPRTEGVVGTFELKPGSDDKGQIATAMNKILAQKALPGGSDTLEHAMNFLMYWDKSFYKEEVIEIHNAIQGQLVSSVFFFFFKPELKYFVQQYFFVISVKT